MARALSGHGPAGVQEWDDDRTVVVVKVSRATRIQHWAMTSVDQSCVLDEFDGRRSWRFAMA